MNVWRVYLDLFMNLMGMMALGGVGLMIIIGGAAFSAGRTASPGNACDGRGVVEANTRLGNGIDDTNCTVQMPSTSVEFKQGEASGLETPALRTVCEDFYQMVRVVEDGDIKGAQIEMVGSASQEYENTKKCSDSKYGKLAAAATPLDENTMRFLCNAFLAADRATTTLNHCLTEPGYASPPRPTNSEVLTLVTIVAEPSTPGRPTICDTTANPNCTRTVYPRLRLQNVSAVRIPAG